MTIAVTIPSAESLGGTVDDVETFYAQIDGIISPSGQYMFDMSAVNFVRPYGAMALISASRRLAKQSGKPVRLKNLADKVHSYLHFMKLFEIGSDWMQPVDPLKRVWETASATPDQLQLTVVTGAESVEAIVARAQRICAHWLLTPDLGNLLSVLSELCANIYQHSGDPQGCMLIQKYQSRTRGRVEVRLAVGDLGQGVRGSLSARHGKIGQEPLDYLCEAMRGRSARATGRGGMGLRLVEQIIGAEGGYLWLRSETAAIFSRGPGRMEERKDLVYMPGTQVAVELHAPLPD